MSGSCGGNVADGSPVSECTPLGPELWITTRDGVAARKILSINNINFRQAETAAKCHADAAARGVCYLPRLCRR